MLREIQVLALKNGIFLYYSSFASQTIMRRIAYFPLPPSLFSNSSLVEFQGERGKPALSWPQRCHRRKEKEKQTVFKHGVRFSLSGLQQEAFALLAMWVSGDTLTAVLK